MQKIISITTDFGDGFATGQLKAVVAGLGFQGQLIENHDVGPFSIIEGAYGIWQLAKFCPPGTVHLGIVDPGVGSERAGIVIKTKDFWCVGPDNGLLYPTASGKIEKIWRIDEAAFENVTNTFHGRDIFIKQAVYLARGEEPRGEEIKEIRRLSFEEGQIVHIDRYGTAKIWGSKTFGLPVVKTYSDVPKGEPLIFKGSSNLLELAVNLGSARDKFGLKLGQVLESL